MTSSRIIAGVAPAVLAGLAGVITAGVAHDAAAFDVKPEARLHLDYGDNDSDARPLGDGLIVRRAVIGLEGGFNGDWSFEVGYNLDSGGDIDPANGKFRDVTLKYKGWDAGNITVGQFKAPFGLEELSSSNNISLIERALPVDAFAPSRRMGAGFERNGDDYTFSAMAYGATIEGRNRGRGAALRLTATPVHSHDTLLHLGLAVGTEKPHGDVDIDTAPESRVPDADLVNTGGIDDASRVNRIGVEGAWRSGPFSVQGEWMQAGVRRNGGAPTADLGGWYLQGSWVLTGESRPYKNGVFKGIQPGGPHGAWELTARFSRIDLDDAGVLGGTEGNATLGVNYYINEHVRIMLNYIRVQSERRGQADNPNLLLLRAQLVL